MKMYVKVCYEFNLVYIKKNIMLNYLMIDF